MKSIVPIAIGLAAAITTYTGGRFALRLRDRINGILGFGAGALIAVALADLLPEALHLTAGRNGPTPALAAAAAGFLLCLILYRLMPAHSHEHKSDSDRSQSTSTHRNLLGVGSLSIHSLLDGLGIGLALKVSAAVGIAAAIGVLVHDFSDGINTVAIVLRNDGSTVRARRWLVVDSCAPMIGVVSAYFIALTPQVLGLLLALFCGLFFYVGACDLLPESYRRHNRVATTLLALLGAATVCVAVGLARL